MSIQTYQEIMSQQQKKLFQKAEKSLMAKKEPNQTMESNAQHVREEPCPSKKGAKSATDADTLPVKTYLEIDIRIRVEKEHFLEDVCDIREAICNFDHEVIRID